VTSPTDQLSIIIKATSLWTLVQKAIFESDARKQATSNLTAGSRFGVRHTSQTLAFDCWSMASGGKN
jgi:hypothetical protein